MANALRRKAAQRTRRLLVGSVGLALSLGLAEFAFANSGRASQPEVAEDGSNKAYVAPGGAPAFDAQQRRSAILSVSSSIAAQLAITSAANAATVGGDVVMLNNRLSFPKASFGLQIYDDDTAQKLTETAIAVGYRNFFASVLAGNQKGFSRGVKAAGVPREELFICGSVVSNRARGFKNAYQATKKGCDENLNAFAVGGITYIDQIMLDYPGPDCESIKGQWAAFEDMLAAGTTKSLSVSNFSPDQLDCLLSNKSATVPTVNQLPYSVGDFDASAVAENKKRGVVVQAWAPLGGSTFGGRLPKKVLNICGEIGKGYGKSAYQVALRWIVDTGATYSVQTRKKEHFIEDLDIFNFELKPDEISRISTAR